ncbi:hypothetical protein Emed_005680 [Eimeria media]
MQKKPKHNKRGPCLSSLFLLLSLLTVLFYLFSENTLYTKAAEINFNESIADVRETTEIITPASSITNRDEPTDPKNPEPNERQTATAAAGGAAAGAAAGAGAAAKKKPQLRQPGPSQQRGKQGSSSSSNNQQLPPDLSPQRNATQGDTSLNNSLSSINLSLPSLSQASAARSNEAFPSQPQFPPPAGAAGGVNILDELMTRGGGAGETETPQASLRPPTSLDAFAIGRAAAAAAAAGIPHLLIGVVLADGSVWGVDDLRGGIESALRSSSMLQQSLAVTDLQQQLMMLNQQQQMLMEPFQPQLPLQPQPYYYPPPPPPPQEYGDPYWNQWPPYPYRRRLQNLEGGRQGLHAASPGVSAAASGRLLNPMMQQRRLQQQLLQQQQQQLQQQQQQQLQLQQQQQLQLQQQQQQQLQLQQHCLATAGPAGAASCITAGGSRAASVNSSLVLPVVGWQPSRQAGSYQVHVRGVEGGLEAVEVSAAEMSRLLQGAQLPLQQAATERETTVSLSVSPNNGGDRKM